MARFQKFAASEEVVEVVIDTSKDLELGKLLQASPTLCVDAAVGERLMAQGIAAKTDEGWMRGYKWHNFYG